MKTMILAAVVFCASHAAAVEINWNSKDPVRQANDQVAAQMGLPEGSKAFAIEVTGAPEVSEKGTVVLRARPLGDVFLKRPYRHGDTRYIEPVLNNDKDRVGADITIILQARVLGDGDDERETLHFVFPELTVDRQTKRILLGSDVVATYKTGIFSRGIKLSKGYHLAFSTELKDASDGFDKEKIEVYSVTLQKVEPKS